MLNELIKNKVLDHLKMITKTDNWDVVYPGIKARESIVYRLTSPSYSLDLALKVYSGKSNSIKSQYDSIEKIFLKSNNHIYRTPKPYGLFEEDGFYIMEWISGETLSDVLWGNCFFKEPLQKNIRSAYKWLKYYHLNSDLRIQEVDTLKYAKSIELNIKRRGSQKLFSQNVLFNKSFEALKNFEKKFIGYKTHHAFLHGDLNLGNILINDNNIVGIDLGSSSHLPIQNDIAEMLTHICTNYFLMLPRSAMRKQMGEWEIFNVVLDAYKYPTDKTARDFFLFVFLYELLQRWVTAQYFHEKNEKIVSTDFLLGKWRLYNCSIIVEGLTKVIKERHQN